MFVLSVLSKASMHDAHAATSKQQYHTGSLQAILCKSPIHICVYIYTLA